ncbi:hypothetical protein B0H13DRAFT_2356933 [Mycena leptocephala]|nr:hypothetical protein B0H13DRAFT_2356933 [Mycena leptocephala]
MGVGNALVWRLLLGSFSPIPSALRPGDQRFRIGPPLLSPHPTNICGCLFDSFSLLGSASSCDSEVTCDRTLFLLTTTTLRHVPRDSIRHSAPFALCPVQLQSFPAHPRLLLKIN